MERVEAVRAKRLESTRGTTRDLAATPTLFGENRQPTSRYLAIPKTSSELRAYIPMAFVQPDIVAGTDIFTSPASGIYHFGVLSSAIHTAWVETVAGRMKSDYRYSAQLVYNNYPWPDPTPEQRARVEEKAQAVLDARAPHLPPLGMNALADIYDPLTMPLDLHKAHVELDRAVELCYRKDPFRTNRERVEFLFRCYEQLTAPLMPVSPQVVSGGANHSRRSPRPRRPRAPQLRSLAQ
jgi:hypothetical protein